MPGFGQVLYTRRNKLGLTLSAISKELGGKPSESFLWRIEVGQASPTPSLSARLARALRLPEDVLINAAGHATPAQRQEAMRRLEAILGGIQPVRVSYPVLDPDNPDVEGIERSEQLMAEREDGFVVRLSSDQDSPYIGEVVAVYRQPRDGQGVIVKHEGRLSAWTYRSSGGETWLENGLGQRMSPSDGEIKGAIVRVIRNIG